MKNNTIERIYVQFYLDDKLETLVFRSEKSLNKFINERKISDIVYKSNKRPPINYYDLPSKESLERLVYTFEKYYGDTYGSI